MKKILLLLTLILALTCSVAEASSVTLLEDSFSSWSGWGWCYGALPYYNPGYYAGLPENISLSGDTLAIQSNLYEIQRKGLGTQGSYQLSNNSKLEVKFGLPADWGYKGIFETFLSLDNGYLGIGYLKENYGLNSHLTAYSSGGDYVYPFSTSGDYKNFIIEINDNESRVGLYSLDDTELWSYTFPYGTNTLGNNARISLTQYAGPHSFTTTYMAFVDNVKLITETTPEPVIPEPSSFLLLGTGLIPFLRRKGLK